ncbi:hypothetical protein BJV82DRAFT_338844 [Fennellomyces sp. T-0311]|nr:hypothetical protein BJV82DRAFT_338844 [Fennellomyces sp. T-0311]
MSQVKASPTTSAQSPFFDQDQYSANRIMTRRASRSAQSSVPVIVKTDENGVVPDGDSDTNNRMTTRSRSIDLQHNFQSSAEESSSPPAKRRTNRRTKTRKRNNIKDSLSPPATTKRRGEERGRRRANKETSETTQLDAAKLQKLAELDELEKTILNGTHVEYRERMAHAEKKRMNHVRIAKLRRELEEADIRYTFDAFQKAAYDQYYQCKAALRKQMISRVQAQIKRLEEEWHARHEDGCSDDDQELYDWVPAERHASIYFEPLGLNQDEILEDLAVARKPVTDN